MDGIRKLFERHQRVALQLSSGKDSAACLWLLQPYWDKLTVVWCNQGNPYPETVAYMDHIKGLVPHFLEVTGHQPEWIETHGFPVDVLPLGSSTLGRSFARTGGMKLQPFWDCCNANSWQPMAQAIKAGGFTAVIRGQKLSDHLQGPLNSGAVVDGIEYCYPAQGFP